MDKTSKITDILKKGVCKLEVNDKFGTAFFFKNTYLMSAGHLFEENDIGQCFYASNIEGQNFSVQLIGREYDYDKALDYAILKTNVLLDSMKPLPVIYDKYQGGKIMSLGVGEVFREDFTTVSGEISGENIVNEEDYFIKIKSADLGQMGFSGAPIFSVDAGAVIGIQSEMTINETGAERDTTLAFPLQRIKKKMISFKDEKEIEKIEYEKRKKYIKKHAFPLFGRMLLGLDFADNLEAYMNCAFVKVNQKEKQYVRMFEIKNSLSRRVKYKEKKRLGYGIEGKMIKQENPTIYAFPNNKCFQLDEGGNVKKINIQNKTKNKKRKKDDDRIALLVAPILDDDANVVEALFFEFFSTSNKQKSIIEIMNNDRPRLNRMMIYVQQMAEAVNAMLNNNFG